MKPYELEKVNDINIYDYVLDFIWQSTLLTEDERKNLNQIETLIKSGKIKNYMEVVQTQLKVKNIMEEKSKFLKLLTPGEKRVVQELVNETPVKDIPAKLGISDKSYSVYMTGIYRKTKDIVSYNGGRKMLDLLDYLFGTLMFRKGDVIIEQTLSGRAKTAKAAKTVAKSIKKSADSDAVSAAGLINSFTQTREYLKRKCDELALAIGQELLSEGKKGIDSSETYIWATRYNTALKVIDLELKQMTCKKGDIRENKNQC